MFNIAIINIQKEIYVLERMAEINFHPNERKNQVYEFLNTLLVHYGYKYNPNRKLFIQNELIPSGGLNYVPELDYDLEEYIKVLTAGTMYEHNGLWVGELLESIYAEVDKFYKMSSFNYIELREEYGVYMLCNKGDIRALRYQEAVDYFEIQKEINSY